MRSSDLKIHKLKDLYQLRYKNKNIVCFHTDAVKTGEYDKSGTNVNVRLNGHGLRAGENVFLNYKTGIAIDEKLTITSTTEDTFTCKSAASVTTAGTVNVRKENVVEHPNKELLEFIKDDLFKCGEFSLNSRNQIVHMKVNTAYILFSSLKSLQNEELYEGKTFREFIKSYYIFDWILVDQSNKNKEELENARDYIKKMITKELKNGMYFEELSNFAKGRLYFSDLKSFYYEEMEDIFNQIYNESDSIKFRKNRIYFRIKQDDNNIESNEVEVPSSTENSKSNSEIYFSESYLLKNMSNFFENAVFTSENEFSQNKISKEITKIYEDSTESEKIAILTLFHYSYKESFLLPLAFIRGGLNKKIFLNALLVIRGNHFNQENKLLYKEGLRYELYQEANELATLCQNFALIGTKEQKKIWEKVQNEENLHLEFKETLSLDVRNYKKGDFDTVKKKGQRAIIESNTLKAICALLNTEGGEIYIGVADKPIEIVGIKKEVDFLFNESNDEYQLHLKTLIQNSFSDHIKLISFRLFEVFKKEIIIIKVKKSKTPVFILKARKDQPPEKVFFIRNGPSSILLDIEEFYNYQFLKN